MVDDEPREPVMRLVSHGRPAAGSARGPRHDPGRPDRSPDGADDEDAGTVLDPVRFPPLPLLSGTALEGADGTLRAIASVSVVVDTADGTRHVFELEPRHGAWWPPRET